MEQAQLDLNNSYGMLKLRNRDIAPSYFCSYSKNQQRLSQESQKSFRQITQNYKNKISQALKQLNSGDNTSQEILNQKKNQNNRFHKGENNPKFIFSQTSSDAIIRSQTQGVSRYNHVTDQLQNDLEDYRLNQQILTKKTEQLQITKKAFKNEIPEVDIFPDQIIVENHNKSHVLNQYTTPLSKLNIFFNVDCQKQFQMQRSPCSYNSIVNLIDDPSKQVEEKLSCSTKNINLMPRISACAMLDLKKKEEYKALQILKQKGVEQNEEKNHFALGKWRKQISYDFDDSRSQFSFQKRLKFNEILLDHEKNNRVTKKSIGKLMQRIEKLKKIQQKENVQKEDISSKQASQNEYQNSLIEKVYLISTNDYAQDIQLDIENKDLYKIELSPQRNEYSRKSISKYFDQDESKKIVDSVPSALQLRQSQKQIQNIQFNNQPSLKQKLKRPMTTKSQRNDNIKKSSTNFSDVQDNTDKNSNINAYQQNFSKNSGQQENSQFQFYKNSQINQSNVSFLNQQPTEQIRNQSAQENSKSFGDASKLKRSQENLKNIKSMNLKRNLNQRSDQDLSNYMQDEESNITSSLKKNKNIISNKNLRKNQQQKNFNKVTEVFSFSSSSKSFQNFPFQKKNEIQNEKREQTKTVFFNIGQQDEDNIKKSGRPQTSKNPKELSRNENRKLVQISSNLLNKTGININSQAITRSSQPSSQLFFSK